MITRLSGTIPLRQTTPNDPVPQDHRSSRKRANVCHEANTGSNPMLQTSKPLIPGSCLPWRLLWMSGYRSYVLGEYLINSLSCIGQQKTSNPSTSMLHSKTRQRNTVSSGFERIVRDPLHVSCSFHNTGVEITRSTERHIPY